MLLRLSKRKPKLHVRSKAIQCNMPTPPEAVISANEIEIECSQLPELSTALETSTSQVSDAIPVPVVPENVADMPTPAVESTDSGSTVTEEPRDSDSDSTYEAPISVVVIIINC